MYDGIMKNKLAFTLIEILISVAIIGILASLTIFFVSGTRSRAADVQTKNNARELSSIIEQYRTDQDMYPIANVAGGADIRPGDLSLDGDQAIPAVSSYLTAGEMSQVFIYSGITAKYVSGDGSQYVKAWSLRNDNETPVNSGNGVYATTNNDSVTAPNGDTITELNSGLAFLTYGPQ